MSDSTQKAGQKRKRNYYDGSVSKKVGKRSIDDVRGVFITCSSHDIFKVCKEIYSVLREDTSILSRVDAQKPKFESVAEELAAMRGRKQYFYHIKPGAKGTLFIGWPRDELLGTPSTVVQDMFTKISESGLTLRQISRVYPIQHSCEATPEAIMQHVDSLIPRLPVDITSVALSVKLRNNSQLSTQKEQFKAQLLDKVRARCPELKGAHSKSDWHVIVQVCKCNAFIGVGSTQWGFKVIEAVKDHRGERKVKPIVEPKPETEEPKPETEVVEDVHAVDATE
eukprot:gnl/Dysnectes_brevis/1543_a1751_2096.p1 GENE.gnl/Dysnectes_brevis/1543_a1751_2096~~gnl/Dysnectes_brevis/1543_a1751_2096.p1  ORF type:complete len:311 (+),score=82.21 gnl/Dysnectes_brevis/1543_a1751_2096:92-934(+)